MLQTGSNLFGQTKPAKTTLQQTQNIRESTLENDLVNFVTNTTTDFTVACTPGDQSSMPSLNNKNLCMSVLKHCRPCSKQKVVLWTDGLHLSNNSKTDLYQIDIVESSSKYNLICGERRLNWGHLRQTQPFILHLLELVCKTPRVLLQASHFEAQPTVFVFQIGLNTDYWNLFISGLSHTFFRWLQSMDAN